MTQDGSSNILVIDEDADIRRSLTQLLSAAGYQPLVAEGEIQGLAMLTRPPTPAAVLLGIHNGGSYDLLAAIHAGHPDVPIVAIAPQVTTEERNIQRASGATASMDQDAALQGSLVQLLRDDLHISGQSLADLSPEQLRSSDRVPTDMALRVRVGTWDQYAVLYAGNISRGGLFIRTPTPQPVGTTLRVRLGLPDGENVEIGAEVVHVISYENGRALNRHPGMGVRFVDWTREQRKKLAALARQAETEPPPVDAGSMAGTEPSAADPEDERTQQLRAFLAEIQEQDYFSMLGLPADASPEQARQAFLQLARKWHPSRFALESDSARSTVNTIFLFLKRARDELVDAAKAVSYRTRIARPSSTGSQPAISVARVERQSQVTHLPTPPPEPPPKPDEPPKPLTADDIFDEDVRMSDGSQPLDIPTAQRKAAEAAAAAQTAAENAEQPPEIVMGERFLDEDKLQQARMRFETVLGRDPASKRARSLILVVRAREAAAAGEIDKATQLLDQAIKMDSSCVRAVQARRALSEVHKRDQAGFWKKLFKK